jgi:peptidyl-prolyl cis-trans isomerase C
VDEARRSAARVEAEAVLRVLLSDETAFEEMARGHSACPSREVGGSLGQIGPGQTAPEFEAALSAIEPGPIHPELVSTRYGFHIVRVAQRILGEDLPFEAAEAAIAAHLEVTSWHIAVRQYLSLLAGRADIRGVALEGAATPLVQ